jgi:hypothetical protein
MIKNIMSNMNLWMMSYHSNHHSECELYDVADMNIQQHTEREIIYNIVTHFVSPFSIVYDKIIEIDIINTGENLKELYPKYEMYPNENKGTIRVY